MSDSEEKLLPPTSRKLQQARKRGEIARSKEMVTAIVTAAGFLSALLGLPALSTAFTEMLSDAALSDGNNFAEVSALLGGHLIWWSIVLIGPFLLLLVAAAMGASIVANGGLVFSVTPVIAKLERLDPLKGFERLFSLRNIIELLKHILKLCIVLGLALIVLRGELGQLVHLPACGLACVPAAVRATVVPFIAICCLTFILFGLMDVGLQRWLFSRDQRMTRTEHKRDRKDAEGDPHLLSKRKSERREAARLGARTGLRHATFIIEASNAALAFRYAKPDATVPILVARQGKEGSHQMVAVARRQGIPVVFDPEAIEVLSGRVEVGKMVPRSAFGPVIRCMKAAGVIG